MTNKKFKLAAMSLALTACVAASPLAANADTGTEVNSSASTTATSTGETKQESTNESKQESTGESKQESTGESKQESTNESKQESTDESKQESTDESKQESTDESKQESTDESKQESINESKQESINESKQESTNESKQESTNESKQESSNESKQESTNESKQESTNESKQESTNESKQESADETKQDAADNNEQDAADNNEQNTADNNEQNAADNNEQNAADVNGVPAAAKAPVLMLAKAPAAPTGTTTTPAEENTAAEDVATINGKGYKSFDEAVKAAESGDTIEVIKDATSTGIDLQNKNLTIKGKTVTTTTDSGTEEKTTVKPKLKFVAKEGQPQIFGITLRGSNLTFQNMDVDMTGASSTTYNKWNAVCMSHDAALTLDNTKFSMDGTGLATEAHGIYMAGRGRNELNVNNHSTLTINNCFNAIAWDGVDGGNEGSTYFINITDGSTFTADGNNGGIIGRESLDVLVDNSTLTVTNCTDRGNWEGRSGFNGADVKIVNGSTANISGNHGGYGIHANNLLVENSTLTANDNGYGSIRITGKGEFINSTVTVTDTEDKGNASVEITWGVNETGGLLNGSLSVRNSTLNISDNNATGIACLAIGGSHRSLTIDDASRVTIQNNNATPRNGFNAKGAVGGGLRIEAGCSAVLGRNTVINNNSADKAGADIFTEKGGKLTFSVGNAGIGDILQDCGDGIDGWYIDAEGQRWNFHGDPSVAQDLLDSNVALDSMGDGTYTLTVTGEPLALKAAHAELPAPTPEPDGSDTPTPDPDPKPEPKPEPKPGPDTSVTPEDPQLTPVQDARTDTPDSSVLPANHTNPAVQDAHALPQTGTSLFAALAMALSGFALTIAGAWASLLGKNSRH